MYFTHIVSDPFQRRPRSLSCCQSSLRELVNGLRLLKNTESLTVDELNTETTAKTIVTRSLQSLDHLDWTLADLLHWTQVLTAY